MANEQTPITAEISISISKLVDRDSPNEVADLKAADIETLRAMGFTITGLSFFYWPKGEAPAWFKARHGKTQS